MKIIPHVLIGYLCGAWLSDHIFMDLAQTHWTSAWVYFWVFLWPLGLMAHFVLWAGWLLAVGIIGLGAAITLALLDEIAGRIGIRKLRRALRARRRL